MGHYAVRRKFVEVFVRSTAGKLSTNDYQGIYVLLEKIRIDENRVNISPPQSGATNDPITGGYIWKRDKGSPGTFEFTTLQQPYTIAANGVAMQYHDSRGEDMSPTQLSWLTNYLDEFETVLYGPNYRDPRDGYTKYADLDSFIDAQWAVEFPKNIDGYRLSDYMHKDRGGKIKMEPLWDWNLSMGNASGKQGWMPENWYAPQLPDDEYLWFGRLFEDPDFDQRYIDRWGSLRTNVFAASNICARVDEWAGLLEEAQARNFKRWPILGRNVHPNWFVGHTYEEEIEWMKQWIRARIAWIDRQFLAAPSWRVETGSQIG